jgi:hypothetical protein
MANPQPEPFVKFSKELYDAILLSPMPATHKEVVYAVIRRTYGDHGLKAAPVSVSLLSAMTGRDRAGISRSLKALREAGVLRQLQASTYSKTAVYALNKNYERWGQWSVRVLTTVNSCASSTVDAAPTEVLTTVNKGVDDGQPLKTREILEDKNPPVCPPTGDAPISPEAKLDVRLAKVREVFAYWQRATGKDTHTLTQDRTRAIRARLVEGITADTICRAVDAAMLDSWWNGKEDGEWKADIKTICGKGSTVERLAEKAAQRNGGRVFTDAERATIESASELYRDGRVAAAQDKCEDDRLWQEVMMRGSTR